MVKASAIILVYHDEKYLKGCVESLRKSAKFANVNLQIIIVVNDERLKNNNFSFPKNCTLIFNKHNLGFGKSINLGVKKAHGDWLLIVNVDTITYKDTLKILFQHKNEKNIGIIAPKILNADKSLQYSILEEPSLRNIFIEQTYLYKLFPKVFKHSQTYKDLYSYSHSEKFVSGAYFIIRKNLFNKICGFDERFFIYFEDIDLCKRVTNIDYNILFESKANITHFHHQSNEGSIFGDTYLHSFSAFLLKYHSFFYTLLCIFLYIIGSLSRIIYWKIVIKFINDPKVTYFGEKKILCFKKTFQELLSFNWFNDTYKSKYN